MPARARYARGVRARWPVLISIVAGLASAVGCSRASEESEAKRSPVPPPPPRSRSPTICGSTVTVDGAAATPITAASLTALAPDFHDDDRRAWKLTRIVPTLARPGAAIEARGNGGISIRVVTPRAAEEPQPVLFLTRRGDAVVTLVDPADPFPGYHGQGGQLRRQGDPLPRLSGVVALAIDTSP